MSVSLTQKARKHWAKWLPAKTAELKAQGMFEVATQDAATEAYRQMDQLIASGYQEHEAEEVVLKELILLAPEEGAGQSLRQQAELARMERAYQQKMK